MSLPKDLLKKIISKLSACNFFFSLTTHEDIKINALFPERLADQANKVLKSSSMHGTLNTSFCQQFCNFLKIREVHKNVMSSVPKNSFS